MLRPREGERPNPEARNAPESPAITPERQPLVAPEHFTHNLPDRLRRAAKTPLSKDRRHCRRPYSVGTQENPLTRVVVGGG
ncbi:hypothetical protein GCM10010372_35940 [Streptomyces tauricus]|nr:hypothetical protein GCM10010372_35940 [Streptomyces tauricus]